MGKAGSHKVRCLFGFWRLTGVQKYNWNPIILEHWSQFSGEHCSVAAPLKLTGVLWILKAKPPKTDSAVIDAVPIEVDYVVRLAKPLGAVKFLAQSRQAWRALDFDLY